MLKSSHASLYSTPSISSHDDVERNDVISTEQVNKQLYRENAELKVRIEFLEQSLRDASNGLLSNDLLQLRKTVEQQQRTIAEQNELIEEAQHIIEGLTNERDSLREQAEKHQTDEDTLLDLRRQLQQAQADVERLKRQANEYSLVQPPPAVSSAEEVQEEQRGGKQLRARRWFQQLCLIILSEEDGALSEEAKEEKILLWCSKAAGLGKRELYWNTVSIEVNALHRLVLGADSSEGTLSQLHRIEDRIRLMNQPLDASRPSILEEVQSGLNSILHEWNPSWSVDVPVVGLSSTILQDIQQLFASTKEYTAAMQKTVRGRESLIALIGKLRKENEQLIAFGKEVMERNESLTKQPCNHCKELEARYENALAEVTRRGQIIRSYEARQRSLLSEQFRSTRRF